MQPTVERKATASIATARKPNGITGIVSASFSKPKPGEGKPRHRDGLAPVSIHRDVVLAQRRNHDNEGEDGSTSPEEETERPIVVVGAPLDDGMPVTHDSRDSVHGDSLREPLRPAHTLHAHQIDSLD